jgi:hypothetical protein
MRVLCVKCKVKLKNIRSGVHVVETFGTDSDDPYRLWLADLYTCPKCGLEVVCGFAQHNYGEHYEATFAERLTNAEPKFWDKSC